MREYIRRKEARLFDFCSPLLERLVFEVCI